MLARTFLRPVLALAFTLGCAAAWCVAEPVPADPVDVADTDLALPGDAPEPVPVTDTEPAIDTEPATATASKETNPTTTDTAGDTPPDTSTDTAGDDGVATGEKAAATDTAAPATAPTPVAATPAAPAPSPAPTPESAPAAKSAAASPATAGQAPTARGKQPAAAATAATQPPAAKKPVLVPGTGARVKGIGDDFEDEKWTWFYNHPKSSEEQDKRMRGPFGKSGNRHWFEGPKRGTPDLVKRIELPAPGLEGSAHGLLISSIHAGIPGRITGQMQQDDLIYNMQRVTGQGVSALDSPSVVVRVYIPPFEQWENRSGPSFGFRAGCYTHAIITGEDHPDRGRFGLEEYWPGMFICFESSHDGRFKQDGAFIRVRGGRNGAEIRGPRIEELGWWTLGLSFSPDGMIHYFASPGVDDLTMDDHITSQFPYGYRTEWLKTFFFNVCTRDDGRTWSTPWVIDDPKVYFVKRPEMATTKRSTKR